MLYVILLEPALAHFLGRVGTENATGGMNVFGDFAHNVSETVLNGRSYLPEDEICLWKAGRRVAFRRMSNDCRRLSFYSGNQQDFPDDMSFQARALFVPGRSCTPASGHVSVCRIGKWPEEARLLF
jgi:hypothetical protein